MARSPRRSPRGRRRPARDLIPEVEPIEVVEPIESLEPIPESPGRGRRGGGRAPAASGGMGIGAKILCVTIPPIALVAIVLGMLILTQAGPPAAKAGEVELDKNFDAGGIAAARLLAAPEPDSWDPELFSVERMRKELKEAKQKELDETLSVAEDTRNAELQRQAMEQFEAEFLNKYLPKDENEGTRIRELRKRLSDMARQPGFGPESGFLNATIRITRLSRTKSAYTKTLHPGVRYAGAKGIRIVGTGDQQTQVYEGTVNNYPVRIYRHPILDWRSQPNGSAEVVIAMPPPATAEETATSGGNVKTFTILFMVLVIGAAVVVSLVLTSMISNPLKSLVRDIDAVARGDTDRAFQTRGGGEIATISRHLEKMTRNLDAMKHAEVEQQTAEAQFSIATQIQENLLPASSPRIEGFEIEALHKPSPDLGTDYHDFLEIDETHLGVILADASLKGTTGAMIMSQVRSLIRAYGPETESPADTLREVNAVFAKDLRKGLYVTAVFMVLNLETGVVTVANAGHAPTVFWKLSKRAIARLPGDGLALGLDEGPVFDQKIEDKRVQLEAGDRVLLFTDGAIEAKNSADEMFGEANFFELVKREAPKNSAAFVNLVANEIDLFHEGNVQKDDITLVTIRKVR